MVVDKGRIVSFSYTLTNKKEETLDFTPASAPYSYIHGYNNLIPGLEKALEGKSEGANFKTTIPAALAYGERDEALLLSIPLARLKDVGAKLEVGMQFEAETPDGNQLLTITEITGENVLVDANHPLAGEDLTFDIAVISVREASAEELAHPDHIGGCGCCHSGCDDNCGSDCDSDCACGCDSGCGH